MTKRQLGFVISIIADERATLIDSYSLKNDPGTITDPLALRDLTKFDRALRLLRREKERMKTT